VADPKAPDVHGWKPQQYGGFARGNWDVDFDGEDLEASVNVSGYGGYGDRMCLPLPELRALLSAHGLAIVSEADKRVIEACAAFPIEALTGDLYPSHDNRNELSDLSLRWAEVELEARKTRAK
jgi:hypothetical protein